MNIEDIKITSKKKFDLLLSVLERQGFHFHNSDASHRTKVERIVSSMNKLKIKYPDDLAEKLYRKVRGKKDDYELLRIEAEKYFAQFGKDDKIMELIRENYISANSEVHLNLNNREEELEKISKNYDLSPIGDVAYIRLYDLSDKNLKINYANSFEELIQRTLEPKFNFENRLVGTWHESFGVHYKIYQNGRIEIKHQDLAKLKDWYRKELFSRRGFGVRKVNG